MAQGYRSVLPRRPAWDPARDRVCSRLRLRPGSIISETSRPSVPGSKPSRPRTGVEAVVG